jgi:hypothetical protein
MPHRSVRALNDRRNAFEAHYARDLQDNFYRQVSNARAAGRWAAQTMGLAAEDAAHYAASVVDVMVAHNTSDPVFEKISADLDARGVTHTPQWLRQQIAALPSG